MQKLKKKKKNTKSRYHDMHICYIWFLRVITKFFTKQGGRIGPKGNILDSRVFLV